jgi:hypothetical protein
MGHDTARTTSFYEVRDPLAQSGCPVCRLRADSAERFLDSLLWESVNDPDKRGEIRRSLGFCREHSWVLARSGASLGVAIVLRDVFQSLNELLMGSSFQRLPLWRRVREALMPSRPTSATGQLVARLTPQSPCGACAWVEKMEDIYLGMLVNNLLVEDGLWTAYEASDGLCLPHFRRALARTRDERVFAALVDTQRTIWERLVAHLGESIRKTDHRFQHEPWGEEAGAWLRAIAALVGARERRGFDMPEK